MSRRDKDWIAQAIEDGAEASDVGDDEEDANQALMDDFMQEDTADDVAEDDPSLHMRLDANRRDEEFEQWMNEHEGIPGDGHSAEGGAAPHADVPSESVLRFAAALTTLQPGSFPAVG